jgi:ubiquinone biosynthesis protein
MTSGERKRGYGAEAGGGSRGGGQGGGDASERRNTGEEQLVTAIRADLGRFTRIFKVLVRHGFHQFVPKRGLARFVGKRFIAPDDEELQADDLPEVAALRFRKVLEELGPTFIKLGQVLSTRPDLLPRAFVRELQRLQDDAPPVPFEEIRQVVEEGLDRDLDDCFADFSTEPLAAASVAQVHTATTLDGDEVVVKVIRPNVREIIEADLDLLHFVTRILEATFEEIALYGTGELVAAFDRAIKTELDLSHEADVLEEFAENMAHQPEVAIPRVYRDLCSRSVLTMERFRGCKLSEVETGSEEARRLIKIGLETTFSQIFEAGLFHGDPHPGNLLALEDGRLGLIDLGMVGRLTPAQQDTLVGLLVTIVTGDIDGIARVVLRMGRVQGRVDLSELRDVVAEIRKRHLKDNLAQVDAAQFVEDLLEAGQRFRIRIGPEYFIAAKASVTVEGVLRALDPDLDIIGTAKPFAQRLIKQRLSGRRLAEQGLKGILSLVSFLRDAPHHVDQILLDLKSGHLRIEARNERLEELGPLINVAATRLSLAIIGGALFVASALLVQNDPWELWGIPFATVLSLGLAATATGMAVASHAIGAGVKKLRLTALSRLLSRRRRLPD